MPVADNREYRAIILPFQIPTEKKRIDSEYYVEGYATTFQPYEMYEYDGVKYYEHIDRNALQGADMSDVIMQYDHRGKVFSRISNGTLGIEPDEKGLFLYSDLSKSAAAREMYEEIRSGLITKMSWAFSVREDGYDKDTRTRKILRIKKVYDVSAVSMPANNNTSINARSYFDGVIEKELQELQKRERQKQKIRILIGG